MNILEKALEIQEELVTYRRQLHEYPELGLELPKTSAFVFDKLKSYGYEPKYMSGYGVVALLKGSKGLSLDPSEEVSDDVAFKRKTILLRGDMDALPIKEETGLDFTSKNDNMHACGHDFHTSILLGAAKLLIGMKDDLAGNVKFMFQPGEEIILGAKEMVKDGILENPKVNLAYMMHLFPGLELEAGTVVLPKEGPSTLAGDFYEIEIQGKGGHGAMPHNTVDSVLIASHIQIALQAIASRETLPTDTAIVSTGVIKAGDMNNIIPDSAFMKGTVRTLTKDTRAFVLERLGQVASGIAESFRGSAKVTIKQGVPSIVNSKEACELAYKAAQEHMDTYYVPVEDIFHEGKILFSEDFSFVTDECPGAILLLAAGHKDQGYKYPLHHPKVIFDELILHRGAAIYASLAVEYLK